MNLILLHHLAGKLRRMSLFFIAFLSIYSVAHASGETISAIDGSDGSLSPTSLGNINPCGTVHFKLTGYTPPSGAYISSVVWYGGGTAQSTVNTGSPYAYVQVRSNDGSGRYPVYCVVHYSNGATGTSNTYSIYISDMNLNTPTKSMDAVLNCTSSISFNTNFQTFTYVPTPSDISSYAWSVPANWSITSSSTGTNGGNPYSTINVTPDASTSGNVSATVTLVCGYTRTSQVLAISRTTPATPTPSISGNACAGGSFNAYTSGICGPTSYTWSVPGSSGLTFSNGSSSLTTTATSVTVSAGSSAPSGDVPVSVVANYPGASSGAVSVYAHVGVPTTRMDIYGQSQGASICEGSLFDVYTLGQPADVSSFVWSVSFLQSSANGLAGGQGSTDAYIQLPAGYSYSNEGDVVDEWLVLLQAQNACGISNWETSVAGNIIGCGGGGTGTSVTRKPATGAGNGLQSNNSLLVFPNPASDFVNVVLPDSINPATVTISLLDIYGRRLKKLVTVSSSNYISLSGLASGVYMVEILDGKRRFSVQKVIKK